VASSTTDNLVFSGETQIDALRSGYHVAFVVGAIFAIGAAALAGALLRPLPQAAQPAHGESPEAIGPPITADAE
jgi:hypothetical protein